jgi:drug/metabolite transporter (DMT)-like permease
MAILPLIAGILAPGLLTVGLFIWQNRWKKDALTLNAFKCSFASIFFGVIVASFSYQSSKDQYSVDAVGYMMLSSVLGIIIADTWWLIALERLGARRMITIDAVKPFLALAFGSFVLQDEVGTMAIIGILCTSFGILLVNLEKREEDVTEDSLVTKVDTHTNTLLTDDGMQSPKVQQVVNMPEKVDIVANGGNIELTNQAFSNSNQENEISVTVNGKVDNGIDIVAYLYALGNVVLDVYAATLIVKWHMRMSSADVNLIRFGFAGVVLILVIGIKRQQFDVLKFMFPESSRSMSGQMNRSDWFAVSGGIVFVTVLTPLINTWVLFKLPLAVAITLNSTCPLWSLPVAYFHREEISVKAILGALLATGGIVLLVLG